MPWRGSLLRRFLRTQEHPEEGAGDFGMMTSSNDEAADLARAKRLLRSLENLLEGTGFVVTSTRTLTPAMIPALEHLVKLAGRYWDRLQAEGSTHDAAALLDDVGLLLERPPGAPYVVALDSIKAILGSDAPEVQAAADSSVDGKTEASLERARESIRGLEGEVEALTAELTSAVARLEARLDVMLAYPRPEAWASNTEAFEAQVLLLLELRYASDLGFNGDNMVPLQEQYSAFLRPRFPKCGCRPLSAITDDLGVLRQALGAFRSALRQKYARPPELLVRSQLDRFASATG